MPTLGLHTLAIASDWRPEEAAGYMPRLIEAGIGVMELPLLRPDSFDAAGTRALTEKLGFRVTCSLGLPARLDVVARPDEALDFLTRALQVAKDAGSDVLGGVTYGTIGRTSGHPPTGAEIDAITRLVERAAAVARGLGLTLLIEPCNRYETHLLNTGAQAAALILRTGADNVLIHMDTYHMNIEEVSLTRGFADAGRFLGYVHLSESNRGVPGQGTVDWDDCFGGLKALGFDGDVVVESFVCMDPDLARGLAVWRPVAEVPEDVITKGLPFVKAAAARNAFTI